MRTLILLAATLPTLAFIGGCPSAAAALPSFMGLGDLPGGDFRSEAYGVSADGAVVVGSSRSAASTAESDVNPEAFHWTESGGMVGLGDLPGSAFYSEATGASSDGSVVVGSAHFDEREAFRWTVADGMSGLGVLPGYVQSWATGVSADGFVIVGYSTTESNRPEAFRWTAEGGMVGLGFLPGEDSRYSVAFGASADGSVVIGRGYSESAGFEAFRWSAAYGMVGLGELPGGTNSEAYALSADGAVVVGVADTATGRYEAFRWTATSGMSSLGFLPGAEFSTTYATSVSGDGSVVVGMSRSDPFIWDSVHGMRSLHDVLSNDHGLDLSGWELRSVNGISADGRTLVGSGLTPQGIQGWIAKVPEPSALAMGGIGLAALMVQAVRHRIRG